MKVGLVLEGGAMRGMYTAGVLDTFLDEDIRADGIVGVSAGALFGINYLSRQRGRVIRYNKTYNCDKNYMGIRPLLREGNIICTQYAYYDVPFGLDPFDDETYRASESAVPFYAVITDMERGEPRYVRIRSVLEQMETLRASGSMPFVSKPVMLDGRPYLDGAVTDSIPFAWMASEGYDKLIVVLTRQEGYRKKPMSRPLIRAMYCGYPAFRQALKCRHEMYNRSIDQLAQWEAEGRAFVLRPSEPSHVGRIEKDPDRLQALYDLGIADCRRLLPALNRFIEEEP